MNGKIYNEERMIAEGGFGYVYAVEDANGQKFALKKQNVSVRIY